MGSVAALRRRRVFIESGDLGLEVRRHLPHLVALHDVIDLANVPRCPACLWDANASIEGAPARNQNAMTASKIMHPNDDVGMKGQIGLPQRWCTTSQQE